MSLVAIALASIALAAVACAPSLVEMAPFPCAADGACPAGLACESGACVSPHDGSPCVDGVTDCAAVEGNVCRFGLCAATWRGACPDGTAAQRLLATQDIVCLDTCSDDAPCPAWADCVQRATGGSVCVGATATPYLEGATCLEPRDCDGWLELAQCSKFGTCTVPCSDTGDAGALDAGGACPAGYVCQQKSCMRTCNAANPCPVTPNGHAQQCVLADPLFSICLPI